MTKIDRQKLITLTDADFDKIAGVVEDTVGKRLSSLEQEVKGSPPNYDGGIKGSVAELWQDANKNTHWRVYISGGIAVLMVILGLVGGFIFKKLDDTLTAIEQIKSTQLIRNSLPPPSEDKELHRK